MKKYTIIYLSLIIGWAISFVTLSSCDDLIDLPIISDQPNKPTMPDADGNNPEKETKAILVLCEGLFQMNNSTLFRYNFKTGQREEDYFRNCNRRGLGDTANDMAIYGSKLYIVVNVSGQLEVVDLQTGKSIKQIPFQADNEKSREPRAIAFHKNKAYVCSFDGTVARIDTTTLTIDGFTLAGRNPEDICIQNNKAYVSNSGGLDRETIGVDHTVSVIDLESFKEIKKIEVGPNPGRIDADNNNNVYVVTRGVDPSNSDYQFMKIDAKTDKVIMTYDEPISNFAIHNHIAYIYAYYFQTKTSTIKIMDLTDGRIIKNHFITDGTQIQTPYSIFVNPYSENIFITEAYKYTTSGDVLCFSPEGQLNYKLERIGQNPNKILFLNHELNTNHPSTEDNETKYFASKVLDYNPAPCQFMNEDITAYKKGFNRQDVISYATERLKDRSLLTLGAFGGNITIGFDHPITNVKGKKDFKIYGNAYYNMSGTVSGKPGGSSEPGIVWVSEDINNNGIPDDPWFELAGSEYGKDSETRNYEVTYHRPSPLDGDVRWTDNLGNEGYIFRNGYHQQASYYPLWEDKAQLTFKGTRLKDNAVEEKGIWVGYCYPWGYADNHPNNTEMSKFDIDWAVDEEGLPVKLDKIHFVKICSAVLQNAGIMGEISTEITTIENLNRDN